MAYTVSYHRKVADDDIPKIPANIRERIARAIETRLTTYPERYGSPLKGALRGYRKLRVGDHRVVVTIAGDEIRVLAILHRKDVYERAVRRAP